MAGEPTYLEAVSTAVGNGLLTGVWIGSGGLPRNQRYAVRLAAAAAVAAAGVLSERADDQAVTWSPEDGVRRPVAPVVVGVVLALGAMAGRRHLERRWLTGLQRAGHEHPHRALALRMGLLSVAATLPGKLMQAYEARAESR